MKITSPPSLDLSGFYLRQIEFSDLDKWYAYLQLPNVIKHTSWDLKSAQDLEPLLQSYENDSFTSARRMAIVDDTRNELIGTVGFHTISDVNKSAEITYDLAPAYWGRGIATRVTEIVTRWSYQTYGFVRVQATVLDTNQASENVLRKCGYQHEGLLRSYRMVRGRLGNFNIYSKLATDE